MKGMWNAVTRLLLAALALFSFSLAGTAQDQPAAEPAAPPEPPIEVMKGRPEYVVGSNVVMVYRDAGKQATLAQGETAVTADEIEYNADSRIFNATGDVKLWDKGLILRGETLRYDLNDQTGEIHDVHEAELDEGFFFQGERLEFHPRAAGRLESASGEATVREYTLYNGYVTGNDLPYPYYKMKFDRLVVAPKVRYWVYDMILVTQSWPLMYLPFYSQSLQENKVAYYLYAASYSQLGFAIFNKLNIVPSDEYMIDLYGDYYTKAGIGKGAKFTFDVEGDYGPQGQLYGYHIKQEAPDNDRIFDGDDRYHFALEYAQDLPYDMRLTVKGHKLSDSEYRDDYRNPERVRGIDTRDSENELTSFVNLTKRFDDQSARITLGTRLDDFYSNGLPYVERKPQVHLEQYPYNILNSGLYGSLQLDYGRYNREQGITFPLDEYTLFQQTQFADEFTRYDANAKLSYPFYFPYQITLEPWLGYRATQYDDAVHLADDPAAPGYQLTPFDFGSESRMMAQAGMDLSTKRSWEFDPFLDRFQRMRFQIEPMLQYSYFLPDTDLEELKASNGGRFPYVDPTDMYRAEMHNVSALLRTKVQGKDAYGSTWDFLRFTTGLAYEAFPDDNLIYDNFLYYDDFANSKNHRFTDWMEEFSIFPFPWWSIGNTIRYDIDDGELRSSYTFTQFEVMQRARFTLGYYTFRYPFLDLSEQQDVALVINWDIDPKWGLFYEMRYDIDDERFRRNVIGLIRNMYDFYATLEFEHENHPTLGDDYAIHIGIQLVGPGRKRPDRPVVGVPSLFAY